MKKLTLCLLSSLTLLAACSTPAARPIPAAMVPRFERFAQNFYARSMGSGIEEQLGERLAPNEAENTRLIEQHILAALKKDYVSGPMRRDVHAKHHGCVKAQFQVNNQALAPDLRVGVFAENKSFPAWIRYSNGSGDASKSDAKGDIRGMAIKLMQVPGRKLLPDQADAPTQDFVMMNSREFFIEELQDYVAFSKAVNHGTLGLAGFAITHPRVAYRLYKIFGQKMANPVEASFFSATAYKLGPAAVKFKVQACNAPRTSMPQNPGPNYLREAMAQSLSQGEACLDFMVQRRVGDMNVENATVEWPESASPYVPVARVRILQQQFDSPQQMNFCENLSFTPWHSLPEHRPLGVTNRVRKSVYELISKFRHEFNGVARREPHDFTIF